MANFCTWNPLRVNTTAALSSVGNLLATMNSNSQAAILRSRSWENAKA